MIFPLRLSVGLAKYVLGNRLWPQKRIPMLVILEPTLRCNLSCIGCGRLVEMKDNWDRMLTVEQCLEAVDKAGAPVACVSGGEPLLHPEIDQIINRIVAKKRFLYLATNGLLLEKLLPKVKPSPYLNFVIHVDGLAHTHDRIVGRQGAFEAAIEAIKAAKKAGFRVFTNTTFFKGADLGETEQLFTLLTKLGVDGIMVVPASIFPGVEGDIFLSREETKAFFQSLYELRHKFKFYSNPLYLQFLAGKRELRCTPWACPTLSPLGWRKPCYVLTESFCETLSELMEQTEWEKYGNRDDPRCSHCMIHNAFETSATLQAGRSLSSLWELVKWDLFG